MMQNSLTAGGPCLRPSPPRWQPAKHAYAATPHEGMPPGPLATPAVYQVMIKATDSQSGNSLL